jgi:hypothetical protein
LRRAAAGVVEQQIEPAEVLAHGVEKAFHRTRVTHVGRHGQRAVRGQAEVCHRGIERGLAPAGEHHAPAGVGQRTRGGLADAGAAAGDQGHAGYVRRGNGVDIDRFIGGQCH